MKKIMFNDKYGLTEAVLEGRKTQTRRIIPNSALAEAVDRRIVYYNETFDIVSLEDMLLDNGHLSCKKHLHAYDINEVVAVAQSYQSIFDKEGTLHNKWLCDIPLNHAGWHNKMFVKADLMPHRIKITNIRVERLQDISDADCLAEGIIKSETGMCYFQDFGNNGVWNGFNTPRSAYATLIDKVSGKGTWESNPYVFIYDFVKVD